MNMKYKKYTKSVYSKCILTNVSYSFSCFFLCMPFCHSALKLSLRIMDCICWHLKMEFRLCGRGRQWCSIIYYHWWTSSIKPRLLFIMQAVFSEGYFFSQLTLFTLFATYSIWTSPRFILLICSDRPNTIILQTHDLLIPNE